MTQATNIPLRASTMSVMRHTRELLIKTLSDSDKRYSDDEATRHVQTIQTEFPKASAALAGELLGWRTQLQLSLAAARPSDTLGESPILELFCSEMAKINWKALLIVERFYPEIPTVQWQEEYTSYVALEYGDIMRSRIGAQSAYDDLLSRLRTIALDEYEDKLTSNQAAEQTVLAFKQSEAAIGSYLF